MSRSIKPVPFFRPSLGRAEQSAVRRVLKSGWLTTGPEALSFEKEFATYMKGFKTLSVNSATSGLHLALDAVGVGTGDLVAVPSLTFTATAEIVRYLGANPVFIDSEITTGNMSTESLIAVRRKYQSIGKDFKAVIPVHLAGHPCNIRAIRDTMNGSDAAIVEDAAHAFPSDTPDGPAGTLGDIAVFSFYATKTITTGEGGMVVTSRPEYEERMKLMRLHGIDRDVWNRYGENSGPRSWEYDVTAPGFKYNMSDIAAAIGRVQLKKAYSLLNQRRILSERYRTELAGISNLELPKDISGHAWHLFIIRSSDSKSRNHLAGILEKEGIGTSVHFIPLHRMTYWKTEYDLSSSQFPVADLLFQRSLSLPLWPGLSWKSQKRIIRIIRKTLGINTYG